jgi:GTP-binding protein
MFIDQAKISVRSGKGGDGIVSFRREKCVPRGGPDGGDGGRGGDVIFVAQRRVRTLLRFRYDRRFDADAGAAGQGKDKHGKNGSSITIHVPVGTQIFDLESGDLLVDLVRDGMSAVVVRGGRGGRGNAQYATAIRQVPRFAEKGEPGDTRELRLELKLLADVGLIGLPNAGKSTFLARVTAAKPKIADYPFTTLQPQLGVVAAADTSFVLADLPGLIEGAAEGKGMGLDFLRHAERCRVLLHLVDVSGGFAGEQDPWESFLTINHEVAQYAGGIEGLPMLIALNKTDVPVGQERLAELQARVTEAGYRAFPISAVTGEGVDALIFAIDVILREAEATEIAAGVEESPQRVVVRRARRELEIALVDEGVWEVTGTGVERLLSMTDLQNEEAVRRLDGSLQRMGFIQALRDRGVKPGDQVMINGKPLEFLD